MTTAGWTGMSTARRKALSVILPIALLLSSLASAAAGPVLDKVKSQGVVRCGAKARPGLLELAQDGKPRGMLVDLCRAIGAAVLGPQGRIAFAAYDAESSYDGVRKGEDDVVFLTGSEILEERLAGSILPGPPVFFETTAVMVP